MQYTTAKAARRKRTEGDSPDPRFAALARLLARDLARKHFDQEKRKEQLSPSQDGAYDSDSPPEDRS